MKRKGVLLAALLLLSVSCFSQENISLVHGYNSRATCLYWTGSELIIGGLWEGEFLEFSGDRHALLSYDPQNNKTRILEYLWEEPFTVNRLHRSNFSNKFWALGFQRNCRFKTEQNEIHLLDEDFIPSESVEKPTYFFQKIDSSLQFIAELPNKNLAVAHDTFGMVYDPAVNRAVGGISIRKSIIGLVATKQSELLLLTRDELIRCDSEAVELSRLPLTFKAKEIAPYVEGEDYYLLGNEELEIISASGQAIFSFSWDILSEYADSLISVRRHGQETHVLASKEGELILMQFNRANQLIKTSALYTQSDNLTDWVSTDSLLFILYEAHNVKGWRRDYLYKARLDTIAAESREQTLDLIDMRLDSIRFSANDFGRFDLDAILTIELHNNSVDTLRSARIQLYGNYKYFCFRAISTADLPETINPFNRKTFQFNFEDYDLEPNEYFTYCACLNSPNRDKNQAEETCSCDSTMLIGLSEKPSIRLPNVYHRNSPIRVPINLEIEAVRLYSLSGRTLSLEKFGKSYRFNSGIQKGIYVLCIYADEHIYRQKILLLD